MLCFGRVPSASNRSLRARLIDEFIRGCDERVAGSSAHDKAHLHAWNSGLLVSGWDEEMKFEDGLFMMLLQILSPSPPWSSSESPHPPAPRFH